MVEGLKRALIVVEVEIEVAKEYGMPLMVAGMNQIKMLLQKELDAEKSK